MITLLLVGMQNKGATLQLEVVVTWEGIGKAHRATAQGPKGQRQQMSFWGGAASPLRSPHQLEMLRSAVWVPSAESPRYCLAWKWSLVATIQQLILTEIFQNAFLRDHL